MIYSIGERCPQFQGDYFVAPNATVIGSVTLGNNVNIWFNAVIRGDNDIITLGENCNVQDGAVIHTDAGITLTLGKDVSVGHMAMLHGCTVGDGTLVGIQAVILNGAVIGRNCLVGAGSLILEGKTFPDGSLIMGSPAKLVRELSGEAIAALRANAETYVTHAKNYRNSLEVRRENPTK